MKLLRSRRALSSSRNPVPFGGNSAESDGWVVAGDESILEKVVRDSLIAMSSSCIVAVMQKAIVLLAILFGALSVQGATISTPVIQDMRFSPPAVPTDLVIPPQLVSHPPALYTDEARRRGVEGSVIVQAQFDEYGSATVLRGTKGLGYGLDEAALEALKGWRFSPALRNGLPVTAVAGDRRSV